MPLNLVNDKIYFPKFPLFKKPKTNGAFQSKDSEALLNNSKRNHTSSGPTMRNLPLFIFLTALVFLFYIFYIYQAQGTELSVTRDQLELTSRELRATKEKLIDAKAAQEKTEASEKGLKISNEELSKKAQECQEALRSAKLQADALNSEKTRLGDDARGKDKELMDLHGELSELRRNNTALDQLAQAQQALVQQLNQTLLLVQKELTDVKAAGEAQKPAVQEEKPKADGPNLGSIIKSPNAVGETLTNNGGALAAAQDNKPAAQEQAGVLEPPKKVEEGKEAERQAEEQEEHEMAEADAARHKENGGELVEP